MCVSLYSTSAAATPGATDIQAGGTLQAAAIGARALGDVGLALTRSRMSRLDALAEEAQAAAKAGRIRKAGARTVSASRADAVAAGVKVTSGSALQAQAEIDRASEVDAMSAILSGANMARGLRSSADYYRRAGVMSAADSLLEAGATWGRTRRPPKDYIGNASAREPLDY